MEPDDRAAVLAEIDATERRLRALADRARDRPGARLADGDWCVRDALCHIAARANDVPLVLGLAEHLPGSALPSPLETDAANARQVAEREGRSVDELLREAERGYAAARAAVDELDAERLRRAIAEVPGLGPMTTADLLLLVYRDHAQAHIASIERVLTATAD